MYPIFNIKNFVLYTNIQYMYNRDIAFRQCCGSFFYKCLIILN